MSDTYFSSMLPQLAQKAARSTVNLLGFADQPLRRHLLDVFSNPFGEEGSFVGDPAFEAVFGWRTGDRSMLELSEGTAHSLLTSELVAAMDGPPQSLAGEYRFAKTQKPYEHQISAWEKLAQPVPQSLVVSSGTGSGKTECFLVPVLDYLVREQLRLGGQLVGVRALFLYPLNALINSQRDRLRAWTSCFGKDLRFCLYNGNTPEQEPAAKAKEFPSEVRDRRTLRATPPPILVTNSTMLEFMLVRSQDAPIIQQSQGKLSWIVLDEAHSYVGSQAAELALMLRRVLHAFGVTPEQVRFVATSATIGDPDGVAGRKLQKFLSEVAGIDEDRVHLVAGKREVPTLPPVAIANKATLDDLWKIEAGAEVSAQRFAALARSEHARVIREQFVGDPTKPAVARLSDIVSVLKAVDSAAPLSPLQALRWLDLASGVRDENKTPFLPLRGHVFHQTLPGLWACADNQCPQRSSTALDDPAWPFGAVYLSVRQHCNCGSPCYQIVACDDCGTVYLEAEHSGEGRLVQPEDVQPIDEFQLEVELVSDEEDQEQEELSRPGTSALIVNRALGSTDTWHVHRSSRALGDSSNEDTVSLRLHEDGGEGLACPACGVVQNRKALVFRKARVSGPFLLSGILPALLEYAPDGDSPADRPYRGRRLLTFSDSRQGTARLATRLQQDSERSRVRGLVYHHVIGFGPKDSSNGTQKLLEKIKKAESLLAQNPPGPLRKYLEDQLKEDRAAIAAQSDFQPISFVDLRQRLVSEGRDFDRMLATYRNYSSSSFGEETGPVTLAGMLLVREFGRRPKRQNSLETMGLVAVVYPALQNVGSCPEVWLRRGLNLQEWRQFLKVALDHGVRNVGALDLRPEWRQWLGLRMPSVYLVRADRDETAKNQRRWPSVRRSGRRSMLVRLLARLLTVNLGEASGQDQIDDCLARAWSDLTATGLLQPTSDGHILHLESLAFSPIREGWLCPVTRRILDTTVRGITSYLPLQPTLQTSQCEKVTIPVYDKPFGGDAAPMDHLAEARYWMDNSDQIRRLREDGLWSDLHDRVIELSPYFSAAEHSAQQSAETLDRYEKDFKDGRLNLLSCSTTMEMGIDIGGVRLVAMNNVPPHPANYLQRAGRAGRRRELRSCAVTLCKSNPHDQAVFAHSRWAFDMALPAPGVSLNSPIIVQRHINALVLGSVLRLLQPPGGKDLNKLTCGWFFQNGESSPGARYADFCNAFDPLKNKPLAEGLAMLVRHTVFSGRDAKMYLKMSAEMMAAISARWINELRGLEVDQPDSNDPAARATAFQKRRLEEEYLLRELATQGFLPAHGFPTSIAAFDNLTFEDIRRLPPSPVSGRDDNRLRRRDLASRDLTTALREYAPGADVVMDGRVYRSAGITLNWHVPASQSDASEVQSIRYAWWCKSCGASGSTLSLTTAQQCEECGAVIKGTPQAFLAPSGFSVDFGSRPHNDISAQGFAPVEQPWISATGDWSLLPNPTLGRFRSTSRGHVYHYSSGINRRGYALCLSCGRAEPMGSNGASPEVFDRPHARLRGGKGQDRICVGSQNTWSIKPNLNLGHEAFTDVLEIQIRDESGNWLSDATAAQTIAVAMRNALAERLGVQVSELSCAYKSAKVDDGNITYSILIFDRHAAGYASGADEMVADLLEVAHARLNCSKECESACAHCVLDFDQRFQVERLDRHSALRWLSRGWLNSMKLPEELRYFGTTSRVEYATIGTAVLRTASDPHVHLTRLVAHGDAGDWDIGSSPLRQLAFDLSARGSNVEVLLQASTAAKLTDEQKHQLASLADHPRTSVCVIDSAPRAGAAWVLAEALRESGAVQWATTPMTSGLFAESWGQGGEPMITGGMLPPLSLSSMRKTGQQLRPQKVQAGDVEIALHREVDGPLLGFGSRLWERVVEAHMGARDLINDEQAAIGFVRYADRYLLSPLSVALMKQVLVGLRMRVGGVRWGRPPVEIATMDCRSSGESRMPVMIFHDWTHSEIRNRVLESAIKSIPAEPTINALDRTGLAHGRVLEVRFSSGRCLTVRFDQGVSYWRAESTSVQGGDAQRRFPFSADVSRQWQQLSQLSVRIEGGSHPTEIFIKVRDAA